MIIIAQLCYYIQREMSEYLISLYQIPFSYYYPTILLLFLVTKVFHKPSLNNFIVKLVSMFGQTTIFKQNSPFRDLMILLQRQKKKCELLKSACKEEEKLFWQDLLKQQQCNKVMFLFFFLPLSCVFVIIIIFFRDTGMYGLILSAG